MTRRSSSISAWLPSAAVLECPTGRFPPGAKLQVKHAVNFIGEFQRVVADEARRENADGVICGHIHHAVMEDIGGIRYINTGDWVESCTAIAEHQDGTMELITWRELSSAPVTREDTTEVEIMMARALSQQAA